jgi:bacterioferritin
MKHADRLIERILMLDGLPNLQDLDKLLIGESAEEMLGCDLKLELVSQASCKEAIKYFESVSDYVSREIVTDILHDTEEHIDWLQTQLELLRKVGVHNYLQSAMGELDE